MQNPDEPRAPVPPPNPAPPSGEPPLSLSGTPAHSPGRGPSPMQPAPEDPERQHRRRRRSSSRRPGPEDYAKQPGKSRMLPAQLNQIALALSALIVVALLVAGAYFYGRTSSPVPAPKESGITAPLITAPAVEDGETPAAPASSASTAPSSPGSQTESVWEMVHEAFGLMREGKLEEAYKRFETVRQVAPDFPGMTYQMARVRMRQRQTDEAYQLANESLSRREEVAESHILRGQIEAMQGSYSAAYTSYEAAIAHEPHRPYAYFYWGEALRNEGRPRQAVERLQQAYDRAFEQPDAFVINLKLLLARAEAGDSEFLQNELAAQLANPASSGEWFVAAAAAALMENKVTEAAGYLTTARERLQPRFYYFVVRDKFFDLYRPNAELSGLLAP